VIKLNTLCLVFALALSGAIAAPSDNEQIAAIAAAAEGKKFDQALELATQFAMGDPLPEELGEALHRAGALRGCQEISHTKMRRNFSQHQGRFQRL
jgi:hypothetical protein